ncbi:MAG TPA: hypothetical protein VKG25_00305 [Bryobacteraceae bacterium]|nr:hypothetical protein [Bryobacteraceae bacterium]
MRICFPILCGLALAAALQSAAIAGDCTLITNNLVSNCGFETGDFTSWTLSGNDVPGQLGNLYGVEGTDPFPLPGGTAPDSGAFQAFFSDLNADPTTLSQTLGTNPGEQYTISFYLAQQLVGPGTVNNSLVVDFGSTTLDNLTNVPVQGYTLYSSVVTATSSSTVLSFEFGNDIGEFLLDDVSVPTPEPASGLLVLMGVIAARLYTRRSLIKA